MPKKGGGNRAQESAAETQSGASPVTDEQIRDQRFANAAASNEIEELSKLRKMLEDETAKRVAAERQAAAAEQRLGLLNQADAHILVAEQMARERHAVLVAATESLKQAKKDYDSAVTELRKRVGDRLEGRPSLFDVEDVSAARGEDVLPRADVPQQAPAPVLQPERTPDPEARTETVPPKKRGRKPKVAESAAVADEHSETVSPGVAETVADAGAIDGAKDEEKEGGAPQNVAPVPSGWWMSSGLGSVSVAGDTPGELLSLPPAMVSALADGGVLTVDQALRWLESETPQAIKGVGSTGRKRLSEVLGRWKQTEGGDKVAGATPVASMQVAAPTEGTHRLCAGCQERWALPSAVTTCPKCNDAELVFVVGYGGEPNADSDGDFVGGVDVMEFSVPAVGKDKGLDDYKFAVLVATDKNGKSVAGYEIYYCGNVGDALYPNCKHVRLGRSEAMEHGLWLLSRSVGGFISDQATLQRWKAAAVESLGVEPRGHLGAPAA